MTVWHCAMDMEAGLALPSGVIRAMAPSAAALTAVLDQLETDVPLQDGSSFDASVYTGTRRTTLDDADSSKWNDDVEPGWRIVGGVAMRDAPQTPTQEFNVWLARFRRVYDAADADFQQLLVWEHTDPALLGDPARTWVQDLLLGWFKPWTRRVEVEFAAYRALLVSTSSAAAARAAARAALRTALFGPDTGTLAGFGYIREFQALGVKTWYGAADQAITAWRSPAIVPNGTLSYATDAATGGYASGSVFSVSYPTGETASTWKMRAAVRALLEG